MKTIIMIILLWSTNTATAAKCQSFAEARKETKGYISWRYERGTKRRCWGTYSPQRVRPVADFPQPKREPKPDPIPEAEPLFYVPPELVPSPPIELPEEKGIIYSTFDGEPPDVWPPIEQSKWPKLVAIALIFIIPVLSGLFGASLLAKYRKDS